MLKFSCADYTFPLLSREQALRLLSTLGIEAVDIGLFARSTHYHPTDLARDPGGYAAQVHGELREHGLVASDVFLQIGEEPSVFASNDPYPAIRAQTREVFRTTIEFAGAIGCGHITGLPGVFHPNVDPSKDFEIAAAEAVWRVETARCAGLIYAVEPHIGSICPSPETALRLLESAPDLTLTLDYGHFIADGIVNADVHRLVPYASHVHVRGGCPGKLQAAIEDNTIDFAGLMERLRSANYTGYICLEYVWTVWQGCNRTDNLSETLLLRRALESSPSAAVPARARCSDEASTSHRSPATVRRNGTTAEPL